MDSSIKIETILFKFIPIICCIAVTSMFFFPFEFRALAGYGLNSKKMLAALSLVILFFKMVNSGTAINKDFINISLLACLVSLCGVMSVIFNDTLDYSYATYISSAWVWWGAAYTACQVIKLVHGKIDWILVINYLVAVCVFQCFMALWMDFYPNVKETVNSIVLQNDKDMDFAGNVHRLYGIGAMLDVAGSRFAAILVMIIYLIANSDLKKRWYEYFLYLLAFIFISVAGSMIARTTLVGVVVGLLYLAYVTIRQIQTMERNYSKMWGWLIGLLLIAVPVLVNQYNTDSAMRKYLRFGFEGFFNYAEQGTFSYSSNEKLKTMYVWPDNIKTWIVGDGYFENPRYVDPFYVGELYLGYYKATDVGYLRFIYYFGLIGLFFFSWYFIKVGQVCMHKFPQWKTLFLLLLLVHFAVWAKVSTDIFLVFAMFLCLDEEVEEEEEELEDELELEVT